MRYADVAGIDAIKGDIQEIIEILLGNQEYRAMGALPIRVSKGKARGRWM